MGALLIPLAFGFLIAFAFTWGIHRGPLDLPRGFWTARLGRSRLRRCNLPVYGLAAVAVGLALGESSVVWAGVGLGAGAVARGIADPLPAL